MPKFFIRVFLAWLPLCVVITGLCGVVYVVTQQSYRLSANDPQIQVAEDAAIALQNGADPTTLISTTTVDLSQSLAPYTIVYRDDGTPLISSGKIDGKMPSIPRGVLEYVREHGESRITWQPRQDIRQAIVVTRFTSQKSGFVVAGRSLREVEKRENQVLFIIDAAWLLILCGSFLATGFITCNTKRN